MKKILVSIIIFSLFLTSCSSNVSNKVEHSQEIVLDDYISDELSMQWDIKTIEMEILDTSNDNEINYTVTSSCISDGKIYYVVSGNVKMSNDCVEYSIFSKDINSGKVNLVFSNEDNQLREVSVMKFLQNNLFWIEEYNTEWKLIKFNLESKEMTEIDSSTTSVNVLPPNIEVGDDLVYWYEIETNNPIELSSYNLKNNKITKYDDTYHLETAFDVVGYQDGYLSYLIQEDDGIKIKVENLNTNSNKILDTENNEIVKVVSNENYIVWLDDWYESNLYVYTYNTDEITTLDCGENNIRSIAIYKNIIVIDFSAITFELDGNMYNSTSAVFQWDIKNQNIVPIFVPKDHFQNAWIEEFDGYFFINSWGKEDETFKNNMVIFKYLN
jgi:hypothetical protein